MNREEILKALGIVTPNTEAELELASMLIFEEMGWEIVYAEHEVEGDLEVLGRTSHSEVVLDRYLFPALENLNSALPNEALKMAKDELVRDRTTMDIAKANQQVYKLLKDGVKVTYRDGDGIQQTERVKLINWNEPEKNQFTHI